MQDYFNQVKFVNRVRMATVAGPQVRNEIDVTFRQRIPGTQTKEFRRRCSVCRRDAVCFAGQIKLPISMRRVGSLGLSI